MQVASRIAERLKTYDPRKLESTIKVSKPHRMIAQSPAPPPKFKPRQYYQKSPEIQQLNPPRGAIPHTKSAASPKHPVTDCPRKPLSRL